MGVLLQPLAAGFQVGVALRAAAYRHGWLQTRRLRNPVVSIGNLTLGGTGKTPLVAFVAAALLKHGRKPAILTRGYGRHRVASLTAIAPGAKRNADPREIGDEPAWLARVLPEVPVVVSADRYRAGRLAEDRFGVDVHLLDDGFQHWALAREVDIVTVDATQELSDRALLPAGRQREPCSALARAQLTVITRAELSDEATLQKLERRIRRINPVARSFRSTTKICGLRDIRSGRVEPAEVFLEAIGKPVAGFCGIGNAKAFFGDLRYWGFQVAAERAYRDHHVYTEHDLDFLRKLAVRSDASVLVTTEKDSMNLPRAIGDLAVFATVIRAQLSEAQAFEEALLARI